MQINGNYIQGAVRSVVSKATNPIKGQDSSKVAKGVASFAVGAATTFGTYMVAKSVETRQQKNKILKSIGVSDEVAQKIINLKNDNGEPVFGVEELKVLKSAKKMEDKTFFDIVMKNIENTKYIAKNKNKKENIYNFEATTKNGFLEVETKTSKGISSTEAVLTNGNKVSSKITNWTPERITETYDEYQDENLVFSEEIEYIKENNKITRNLVDVNNFGFLKKSDVTKFDSNGVLTDKTKVDYDLSVIEKLRNQEISKEEFEKMVGKEISDEEYSLMVSDGELSDDMYEKIISCKALSKDFVHNVDINSKCGLAEDFMKSQVRTYTNPRTGKTETIKMELSEVPGVYNSVIIDEKGNSRVESQAIKDKFGNIKVEKNLESLDGTKTHYTYESSKDENDIKMHYQIKDSKGNVLTTIDRTFKRVSPTLAYSSINGNTYKIEKKEDSYEVTDYFKDETTILKFDDLYKDLESKVHNELFDKMSGDMMLDMYNRKYKYHHTNNTLESYMREDIMMINTSDDMFVFAHEQGHTKDVITKFDKDFVPLEEGKEVKQETVDEYNLRCTRVTANNEFAKTYEQERAAFMTAFPDIEQKYIDYFIDRIDPYNGFYSGRMETVAETNALFSTSTGYEDLSARSHYLQKYFPRTIAVASKILMPNAGLYVKNS